VTTTLFFPGISIHQNALWCYQMPSLSTIMWTKVLLKVHRNTHWGKVEQINWRKQKEFNIWNFLTRPQSSMQCTCHYIHNFMFYNSPKHNNKKYENNSIHIQRKDACHTSTMLNCPFSHSTNFLCRLKVVIWTPWRYVWERRHSSTHSKTLHLTEMSD